MGTSKQPGKESRFHKSHLKRALAVGLLVAIAAAAFTYGVGKLFSSEDGWRTVECTASAANCSNELIFTYQLGVSGKSPTAELKAVSNLYNEKAVFYYRLFHATEQFEDTVNIAALNAAPNTVLTLPAELYNALKKANTDPGRNIFLAPIFAYYDTLFSSSFDEDAATWDPAKNPELAKEFANTLSYAKDEAHIRIELQNDQKAKLFVSDDYLAYAKETGIKSFIDFYWMKNAFIVDALAADLLEADFPFGTISSRDGFIRNLSPDDTEFVYDVFDERSNHFVAAGRLIYKGSASICTLRSFVMDEAEQNLQYTYADGTRVTRYISVADALPHGPAGSVTVYSKDLGCAELLLSLLPCYLAENLQSFSKLNAGMIRFEGSEAKVTPLSGFTYTANE